MDHHFRLPARKPRRHRPMRRSTLSGDSTVALSTPPAIHGVTTDYERLALLAEASHMLISSTSYEPALATIAHLAVPLIADWCIIFINDETGTLHYNGLHYDVTYQPLVEGLATSNLFNSYAPLGLAETIHTRRLRLIAPVTDAMILESFTDAGQLDLLRQLAPHALMQVPLTLWGRTGGVMLLALTRQGRSYSTTDAALAGDLARRAMTALENASLHQTTRRRLIELSIIQAIARIITSTHNLDSILSQAVEHTARSFSYHTVLIYLRDGDILRLRASYGYPNPAEVEVWPINRGVVGRVARTAQPVYLPDVDAEPEYERTRPETTQLIAVPLLDKQEQAIGVLLVTVAQQPHLSSDDLRLLTLLADQISVAVTNARLVSDLRFSEQRYRTLVARAADGIALLDAEGTIIEVNERLAVIVGYTREQLLGCGIETLIAPEERQRLAREQSPTLLHMLHSHGDSVPVEVSTSTLENGVMLAIVRDISERLRIEAHLRQTQKSETIGTLVNGIAHDFNNLLMSITGSTALLLEQQPPDSPFVTDLLRIQRAAERGAGVIQRLLAFSRPTPLWRQVVSPHDLLQEALAMLRPLIPSSIKIVLNLQPGIWNIEVDVNQFQQVLLNLVVNARDAMPSGGQITISAGNVQPTAKLEHHHPGYQSGPHICLQVQDTGVGMDEHTLSRAFDPFFTTKPPGQGTGLGMATSLSIVRAHGGMLELKSAPGCGTTATIYLPATAQLPSLSDQPVKIPQEGAGELVLVVDDEESVRETVRRILERYGYRVCTAADGIAAINAYRQYADEVAVVLLDLTMPEMDGRTAYHNLRTLTDRLPIILSSGQSGAEVAAEIATPATGFLPKPYTPAELTGLLKTMLAQTQGQNDGA